ncbi:glycosyltransferase [Jiulongibacter sediminis]|uniref:glycosyltransferase n=1 Tax=Jiulongibacter sediminis TaxID=1605367 RepID=UPI0009E8EB66|nr:glycosyltransferase [Jiulongibacter sediminis]
MKIAFVSPFPPSKVTLNEYGYHLIKSFKGKPEVDEIVVLTNHLENNEAYGEYAIEGIELIPCWSFDSWTAFLNIRKEIKKQKPDVVIFNLQFMTFGEGKIPAALGLLTPLAVKTLGIPSIVLLHNITETVQLENIGMADSKLKARLFLWIGEQLTKLLLQADLLGLTISKYVDIIREKYKAENVTLLPHGNFELPERSFLPNPLEEINLMAFGKFGTYKKVEVMLDAVKILEQRFPNLKFKATVAGTDNPNVKGYLNEVEKRYADMKHVEFTGYVREEDVEGIFKASTFIIFPYTTTTGSSGILHQAGSYARACILPKIDDLERVVEEEGYGGAYFQTDNAESMANAIAPLIENPAEREKLEDMNYEAAKGLQMTELADMYLRHIQNLRQKKISKKSKNEKFDQSYSGTFVSTVQTVNEL